MGENPFRDLRRGDIPLEVPRETLLLLDIPVAVFDFVGFFEVTLVGI